ncbi:hypothetical protein AU210_014188 [Fusarium oxysporum f. sp. radicis-cucumerinum]|uniref:mannan endo-1,4-beta-mannosidase n=1 Tax=Fusarium oxysporum f. sp. radicis-cucumerinum TaxID=327505 RepID=A0A2H3G480_FUSOX|nr:hypothetical protein AU210_014188 [Fusarium oxysporum f. sp. radicis-cucumerinum]
MLGLFSVATANAAKSFSASNLYYAAGLTDGQQTTLLNGLQSAGVKVLRVWLDGATKGTPINDFKSLQGTSSDDWDDTVLNRLDTFMVKAHDYGIKLLISIHSYNALEKNSDFYGKWYGTGDFYTSSKAISQFKDRIAHVLAHKHPKTGKTGPRALTTSSPLRPGTKLCIRRFADSRSPGSMMHLNNSLIVQGNPQALASWQCTMAKSIKDNLNGNSKILVTTGGGAYLDNSLLDAYFTCDSLDVLAIHAYGVADLTTS